MFPLQLTMASRSQVGEIELSAFLSPCIITASTPMEGGAISVIVKSSSFTDGASLAILGIYPPGSNIALLANDFKGFSPQPLVGTTYSILIAPSLGQTPEDFVVHSGTQIALARNVLDASLVDAQPTVATRSFFIWIRTKQLNINGGANIEISNNEATGPADNPAAVHAAIDTTALLMMEATAK